jgi:hypothetical protein
MIRVAASDSDRAEDIGISLAAAQDGVDESEVGVGYAEPDVQIVPGIRSRWMEESLWDLHGVHASPEELLLIAKYFGENWTESCDKEELLSDAIHEIFGSDLS